VVWLDDALIACQSWPSHVQLRAGGNGCPHSVGLPSLAGTAGMSGLPVSFMRGTSWFNVWNQRSPWQAKDTLCRGCSWPSCYKSSCVVPKHPRLPIA